MHGSDGRPLQTQVLNSNRLINDLRYFFSLLLIFGAEGLDNAAGVFRLAVASGLDSWNQGAHILSGSLINPAPAFECGPRRRIFIFDLFADPLDDRRERLLYAKARTLIKDRLYIVKPPERLHFQRIAVIEQCQIGDPALRQSVAQHPALVACAD